MKTKLLGTVLILAMCSSCETADETFAIENSDNYRDNQATKAYTTADGRKWWGHVLVIGSDIGGAFIGGGLKDPRNAINIGGKVSNATDKYLEKEGK